jgi:hypothetical protein
MYVMISPRFQYIITTTQQASYTEYSESQADGRNSLLEDSDEEADE